MCVGVHIYMHVTEKYKLHTVSYLNQINITLISNIS